MPEEHHVDPTRLEVAACFDVAVPFDVAVCFDAAATALARSRAAALDASHELLAHYADTGDAATQRTVDTLVSQAGDALGALTGALADTSRTLQAAASRQRHEQGR